MEKLNTEIGWNQLRYDVRTYTAQNERNRRGGEAGRIPAGYRYIGDKCFLNNGKVHEVVLPQECRIIGKQAFEGCQFQNAVDFPEGQGSGLFLALHIKKAPVARPLIIYSNYQEKMKAYVSDTAFVLQDHLQNFRHIGTRYSKSVVLLQSEDFYPYIC